MERLTKYGDTSHENYEERLRIHDYCGDTVAWNIGGDIKSLPATDVEPVRRGEWIEDDYAFNRCSECGYEYEYSEMKTPYCSNCGAKMEYEEDTI